MFDKASVEAIVGVKFPAMLKPDQSARIAAARGGYAECKYRQQANQDTPKHLRRLKTATVEVDCRERRLDLNEWSKQARTFAGKADDEYRQVDVGKGGGYSHAAGSHVHQLLFIHSTVPCTVHVTLLFIEDNQTEALARHVDGKLTAANRPQYVGR